MARSLLLGNGFEIFFNENMRLDKLLQFIIERQMETQEFINKFVENNLKNITIAYRIRDLDKLKSDLFLSIKQQATYYDDYRSVEDNILSVESILIENYFYTIEQSFVVEDLFLEYVRREFCSTEETIKTVFNEIPEAKEFLKNYEQVLTTNYSDYNKTLFDENKKTYNIHGQIDDADNKPRFARKNLKKEDWNGKEIKQYEKIDLFGLSLKNDLQIIANILYSFSHFGPTTVNYLNYYYYSEEDKQSFKDALKIKEGTNALRLVENSGCQVDLSILEYSDESMSFNIKILHKNLTSECRKHHVLKLDKNENPMYLYKFKLIIILRKADENFWGYFNKEINKKMNDIKLINEQKGINTFENLQDKDDFIAKIELEQKDKNIAIGPEGIRVFKPSLSNNILFFNSYESSALQFNFEVQIASSRMMRIYNKKWGQGTNVEKVIRVKEITEIVSILEALRMGRSGDIDFLDKIELNKNDTTLLMLNKDELLLLKLEDIFYDEKYYEKSVIILKYRLIKNTDNFELKNIF